MIQYRADGSIMFTDDNDASRTLELPDGTTNDELTAAAEGFFPALETEPEPDPAS